MKILLSWLKEYIPVHLSIEEIAQRLTMAGLEVDGIEKSEPPFTDVVVAEVVSCQRHPDAEKLSLATVSDGEKTYQVVCGAPNCRQGIKTAFAKVGAKLSDGDKVFKVKEAKIRGIESFGMLCSEKELNLSEEHEGIIEFGSDKILGENVGAHLSDVIFDISITPNLGHCLSVLGIARELSAITEVPMLPLVAQCSEGTEQTSQLIELSVESVEKCPKYCCRILRGIKVGNSPSWLKQRLEAVGMRSINNVVDITNYVMHALGHPLHAFDLDKIEGSTIIVRQANEGEILLTLDGKERLLHPEDLVIADASGALALAGVMGGMSSQVDTQTKDVLIESAYFLPKWVRRTSKRHGLSSEASKRFERGTDPERVHDALNLAAALMQMCAGGEVCAGIIEHIEEIKPRFVEMRISYLNRLLGFQFSTSEVENFFSRLHFEYTRKGGARKEGDDLIVKVPSYRHDITQEVDLIEEIAKLYGFGHFTTGEVRFTPSLLAHDPLYLFEREVRSRLVGEGLQELLTCDLISPQEASSVIDSSSGEGLQSEAIVKVVNPTSLDQSVLRHTLLPGLLRVAKYNWDRQVKNICGFEVGRIHFKEGNSYLEPSALGIIWTGEVREPHWERKAELVDFYDLKGVVENLLKSFGIEEAIFTPSQLSLFHPGRSATLSIGGRRVGSLGQIHPAMMRKLDLPADLYYAEVILNDLIAFKKEGYKYAPLPLYPSSERDWTVTLKEGESAALIFDAVKKANSSLLKKTTLVDVYDDTNRKVTFRFMYLHEKKTLSQEQVDAEHGRLIEKILMQLGKA